MAKTVGVNDAPPSPNIALPSRPAPRARNAVPQTPPQAGADRTSRRPAPQPAAPLPQRAAQSPRMPVRPRAQGSAPPAPQSRPAVPPTGRAQPLRPRTLGAPTARVTSPESRHAGKLARTAAQAAGRPIIDKASTPEAIAERREALQDAYNESRGKVRAKRLLFYDMARRREGDVFVLREAGDFKTSQMEWVSASTPEHLTTPREAAMKRDRNIAGLPRERRLAANAADDADDQTGPSPLE